MVSAAFHVRTSCSAQELKELYGAGPADKFESVELELLSVEKLLAEGPSQTLYASRFGYPWDGLRGRVYAGADVVL